MKQQASFIAALLVELQGGGLIAEDVVLDRNAVNDGLLALSESHLCLSDDVEGAATDCLARRLLQVGA